MTDRLSLYRGALRLLSQRPVASLSEEREPRRILDSAWDGGAVRYCLEAGQWRFASRNVQADASPSDAPEFGYQYAFTKPEDFVRTCGVWSDEWMHNALEDYRDEGPVWSANLETIYIRYVSNADDVGFDYSRWPQSFVYFVEAHLAAQIAMPLTESRSKLDDMLAIRKEALREALSHDAMSDPTRRLPAGSWVRARFSSGFHRER